VSERVDVPAQDDGILASLFSLATWASYCLMSRVSG
jgi:hypothetical protein